LIRVGSKLAVARSICCSSLLLSLCVAVFSGRAQAQTTTSGDALSWLDADAGLVLSIRISQLQELNDLLLAAAPEARSSISLATLGAAAVLGWNPFQESAWANKGFATESNLYLQVEAINAIEARASDRAKGSALWRTRMILPAKDAVLAKAALANIRFRDRADLESKSDQTLAKLLNLPAKAAKRRQAVLRKAGVFLVAKPTILPGLLLISQHQDLFVVDLIRPYGPLGIGADWSPKPGTLVRAISRRPDGFAGRPVLAEALRTSPIGIALAPERASEMLLATELDGLSKSARTRKAPKCAPFVALAKEGNFDAVSLRAEVDDKSMAIDIRWHLRQSSQLLPLLTTHQVPIVAADQQALHALVRLDQVGRLRQAKRSTLDQTWDALWLQSKQCHAATSSFALAIDWPHIAGLFLDEVSALDPQAELFIDNLGSMAISTHGEGLEQQLFAEAWVRTPGFPVASGWMRSLFGHERTSKTRILWSQGPMRPYALLHREGAVFGSNVLGLGQRAPEMASIQSHARGTEGSSLLMLRANPSKLREGLVQHPLPGLLAAWKRLSADLTIDKDLLRFTMDLQRD
jgi:hypothetical protein